MTAVVDTFKHALIPGSEWFLLVGATLAVVLLYARARAGRTLLTLLVVGYWAMSTPVIGRCLEWSLTRGYSELRTSAEMRDAGAIVILGAGSFTCSLDDRHVELLTVDSAYSVLEAERLFRMSGGTPLIITSGGRPRPDLQRAPESQVLRDALVGLGVPADRIVQESVSLNTYEQAVNLGPVLAAHGIERFVLVASATHMWRSLALFHAQRLFPIAGPAPLSAKRDAAWEGRWLPAHDALLASRGVMYHYMAFVYALARGWTKAAGS